MQYALMVYSPPSDTGPASRPMPQSVVAALERPEITGWARLHLPGSATVLRHDAGQMLLSDGPFIDSKEYLGGLFLIEAANLDAALALAEELLHDTRDGVAIEVRPILQGHVRGS